MPNRLDTCEATGYNADARVTSVLSGCLVGEPLAMGLLALSLILSWQCHPSLPCVGDSIRLPLVARALYDRSDHQHPHIDLY